eukprot:bmy_08305T0
MVEIDLSITGIADEVPSAPEKPRAKAASGHLTGLRIYNVEMVQGPEAGSLKPSSQTNHWSSQSPQYKQWHGACFVAKMPFVAFKDFDSRINMKIFIDMSIKPLNYHSYKCPFGNLLSCVSKRIGHTKFLYQRELGFDQRDRKPSVSSTANTTHQIFKEVAWRGLKPGTILDMSSGYYKTKFNRNVNYITSWLSMVGPAVGLNLPLSYARAAFQDEGNVDRQDSSIEPKSLEEL